MIPAQHAEECADIATSSDDYARRFSGTIGAWLVDVQSQITKEILHGDRYATALDVGGGHGQLISPLTDIGARITILGSDQRCTQQIQAALSRGNCIFIAGSLENLPFPRASFDLVTSIRFISHCPNWKHLVAELCRVAKVGVFIDYPPLISSNLLAPIAFQIKKRIEGNTRPFSIFTHRDIRDEFAKHGFRLKCKKGQFFWPMAVHRLFKNRSLSVLLEGAAEALQLRSLFGSPTLALFEKSDLSY